MNIDTKDTMSVTEASRYGVSKLVADAEKGHTRVVLRNNEAVVNIPTMERLQRLDELESDLRLLSIALVRSAADSGRRYDLDDVVRELGVDPAED
jgi:hypothetical protein